MIHITLNEILILNLQKYIVIVYLSMKKTLPILKKCCSPLLYHLHWLWKWKIVNVHLNWWVLSNRKVSHCYDLTQSFMYYLKNSTCRIHIHSSTTMISNIPYSTKSDTQRTSKSYTSDWYILPFNTFSLEQFQYISPLCNWYMAERKYLF